MVFYCDVNGAVNIISGSGGLCDDNADVEANVICDDDNLGDRMW